MDYLFQIGANRNGNSLSIVIARNDCKRKKEVYLLQKARLSYWHQDSALVIYDKYTLFTFVLFFLCILSISNIFKEGIPKLWDTFFKITLKEKLLSVILFQHQLHLLLFFSEFI